MPKKLLFYLQITGLVMGKTGQILEKSATGFKRYLTDWKNLAMHALIGVALVVLAIWAPVPLYGKIAIFLLVVVFNVFRMRINSKKRAQATVNNA